MSLGIIDQDATLTALNKEEKREAKKEVKR